MCLRFLRRAFAAEELRNITIVNGHKAIADLHFDTHRHSVKQVLARVADCLEGEGATTTPGAPGHPEKPPHALVVAPIATATDRHGVIRYHRYGHVVTGWQVIAHTHGSLKLKNPVLYRRSALCEAIERELISVLGVDRYQTHSLRCSVHIHYDPRRIGALSLIEILDGALATAERQDALDKLDLDLTICTAALPVAAAAQFAVPALLPVAAGLFAYTAIPCFKGAYEVLVKERRLGIDVLDSIVVLGCLATLQIFPGAVLAWCLSFGRLLVKKTEDNSKKLLLNAFGKQPRFVWLVQEGVEIEVPLDRVAQGDIVAVNTGDMVPVDGHIVEGMAMIDQQALTGESTPAE
ncbi:MAG: heavy metal translocating P-type ATPase, partial [Gammaproteobacteria bacterium]|nr:heavy metal translocating P-type ATPase [Gammaproteobacteria bacterium]